MTNVQNLPVPLAVGDIVTEKGRMGAGSNKPVGVATVVLQMRAGSLAMEQPQTRRATPLAAVARRTSRRPFFHCHTARQHHGNLHWARARRYRSLKIRRKCSGSKKQTGCCGLSGVLANVHRLLTKHRRLPMRSTKRLAKNKG